MRRFCQLLLISVCFVGVPAFLAANYPKPVVQENGEDKEKKGDEKKAIEALETLEKYAKETSARMTDLKKKMAALELENEAVRDQTRKLEIEIDAMSNVIRRIEQDKTDLFRELLQSRIELDECRIERSELRKRVEEMEELARKMLGVAPDPTAANPPRIGVQIIKTKGAIINVLDKKDGVFVKVSLGTDNGVNVFNTLEVYRGEANAEYLGRLRIISTTYRDAVGRLIVSGKKGAQSDLQVGDIVVDRLLQP